MRKDMDWFIAFVVLGLGAGITAIAVLSVFLSALIIWLFRLIGA